MRCGRKLVGALAVAAVALAVAAPEALADGAVPPITSYPGFNAPCPAYSSATGQPTTNPGPHDVRICSGQVPSWDDVYLDVDLTLPINDGGAPHPLIFMGNGFGSDKHYWESNTDEGDGRDLYHWNNHWFATHGYYVLTYTPRGFRGHPPSNGGPSTPPGDSSRNGGPLPGSPSTAPSPRNSTDGTIRLKSIEFEMRDTEWLMALIAASYNVNPQELAATGDSYGGGESWLLASQGHFDFPQIDLGGKQRPLEFQVSVPKYGWTDLGYSLAPNGHRGPFPSSTGGCDEATANDPCYSASSEGPYRASTSDCFDASLSGQGQGDPRTACNPFGVPKDSYLKALFALGGATGTYEEGVSSDLSRERDEDVADGGAPPSNTAWFNRTEAGDPFDTAGVETESVVRDIRRGLTNYRSSYYQTADWEAQNGTDPTTGKPRHKVAIFAIQGWTDDLFEPIESFREFKYLKSLDPQWPVEIGLGDVGHSRAQNLPDDWHPLNDQAWQFLQSNINGSHDQQTIISSQPTKCANSSDPANNLNQVQALTATTPEGLHKGRLIITYTPGSTTNVVTGTDPDSAATDPIVGGAIPTEGGCRTSQAQTWPGRYTEISQPLATAETYIGQGVVKVPYTLLDAPPSPAPSTAILAARVWEVEPSGNTLLMTRGVYRIDVPAYDQGSGELRLPLFGNHWPLLPGDKIRLDLTEDEEDGANPAQVGMFQKSNEQSAIQIGTTDDPPQLILPTREAGDTSLTGAMP